MHPKFLLDKFNTSRRDIEPLSANKGGEIDLLVQTRGKGGGGNRDMHANFLVEQIELLRQQAKGGNYYCILIPNKIISGRLALEPLQFYQSHRPVN